jgi:hypothetical protein
MVADVCFCVPQDEKAKLQALLSSATAGSNASEARLSEMQSTIDSLRWGRGGCSSGMLTWPSMLHIPPCFQLAQHITA